MIYYIIYQHRNQTTQTKKAKHNKSKKKNQTKQYFFSYNKND